MLYFSLSNVFFYGKGADIPSHLYLANTPLISGLATQQNNTSGTIRFFVAQG